MTPGWKSALALLVLAICVVVIPLLTIAALNELFALTITVTVGTWASALWLGALLTGGNRLTRWLPRGPAQSATPVVIPPPIATRVSHQLGTSDVH